MDRTSLLRRMLAAAVLAAAWVAALETLALAVRPGVPATALGWLGAATFGLGALALALATLPLLGVAQLLQRSRRSAALRAHPRLRVALVLLVLALSVALHVANARLYVRLYAGIHATLSVLTLACALLGFALLLAPRAAAPGERPPPSVDHDAVSARRFYATLLAGFAAWLVVTAVSLAWVVVDETLRAHALEQSTLLDDALLAADRLTGILQPLETRPPEHGLDPQLLAAVEPRPLPAVSGLARGANLVMVTIDSMRADRWSAGGARTPPLPAVEALGGAGLRFARAYAPSCWTMHSMSAVLFDRLPSQIRFAHVGVLEGFEFAAFTDDSAMVRDARNFRKVTPVPVADQPAGFIEALRSAGYQTATVAAYIYYFRDAGLTAKFEYVDEDGFRALGIGASGIAPVPMVERAAHFLDQRDPQRPFFLWLHFMEPHAPYIAHGDLAQDADAEARYDSELRHVDTQLAALRAELDERGLDGRTLYVVHADHGEEFGDHGGEFHATTLYEEIVRVPLLVRLPVSVAAKPAVIETPVSLLDLGPTVLDLLGVPTQTPLMGRSLTPAFQGQALTARPILMECERFAARKRAYLRWPFKLIVDRATGTSQLFALHADPLERDNLASREPALLQAMAAELNQLEGALAR